MRLVKLSWLLLIMLLTTSILQDQVIPAGCVTVKDDNINVGFRITAIENGSDSNLYILQLVDNAELLFNNAVGDYQSSDDYWLYYVHSKR